MKVFNTTALLTLICVLGSKMSPVFGIRYTITPSLPFKIFISRPFSQAIKNHYISIEHPQSTVLLAKQIVGVAGDRVTVHDNHLYINERDYGLILKTSESGKQLQPITQQEIPEGYVFAYAPHKESFDSRYAEFGLVKTEQIKETLWPLF